MNRTYNDLHAEMTEWLERILKDGLDSGRFATVFLEEEEPDDGVMRIEVKGIHSKSGNPVPASFDYYEDADESE